MTLLLASMLAFLIGSFPTGVILSQRWAEVDVRYTGSGHTGGMNVARNVNLWLGVLTVLVDAAKGIIAVALGEAVAASPWVVPVAGMAATVGHCWPLYTGFQGGMGLATLGGILLYVQAPVVILAVPLWFMLNHFTKHPPRSTMATVITVPVLSSLLGGSLPEVSLGLLGGAVIFVRHIPDWKRVYEKKGQAQRVGTVHRCDVPEPHNPAISSHNNHIRDYPP